ncbi:lipid A biosynthesis lauroyltransferase [Thiohalobacter sp. COW1]|uniref:LpxL/LpxP family Kdo(2)-lipid IV(A) lauroyl/palmitoleoyl acyltransferase n=1 Tax=Thiohalobacter sp. COW1 TaxID=2795687 RepID=UPI001914FB03|nr:LpxL/LpxP family Kdo(2)-lipid IV(A) lauroyl/palmitoleoyl acyltransferase [Thiohalobacter sp. COW1]BCO31970.1 lipid A biosynthesis lauroyltransferase [Thiohalobacter sp. COW1]
MPRPDPLPPALLAPRHWPTWLLLGLGWGAAQLPWPLQRALGRGLGRLLYRLARERRRIARINLELCFPELDARARAVLLRQHFQSLGLGVIETAMSWWTPAQRLAGRYRLEGLEHLQAALARGRGVILLSAHFTTLEIAGRLLALQTPFHVLYRTHKNPVFERAMRRARERHFERAIAREDMRGFLRSLKRNMPVWYAPDQDYGREKSVFTPFFGVPAATITATSRLAAASGAAVVPFFPERRADGRGYILRLQPALADFPGASPEADAARINALIEAQVRTRPGQYLWAHRRFKTRPGGAPAVY